MHPEHFDDVTSCQADIVGFTPLAATMPPEQLVKVINRIFEVKFVKNLESVEKSFCSFSNLFILRLFDFIFVTIVLIFLR